jgi:hypothetical protein
MGVKVDTHAVCKRPERDGEVQCAKKTQPAHRRYKSDAGCILGVFHLCPPIAALKTTRHRGKPQAKANRHSAPVHKISGSRTS